MKRFVLLIVAIGLVLVGCVQGETSGNNEKSSNTPKEALINLYLEEGFAEVIEIYETIEINEDRVISVYKGIMENDSTTNEEDIYVANIEKRDGVWLVTDATNIGLPSVERLDQSSLTEKFEAGYTREKVMSTEKRKTIKINNNDIKVWIEVF